MQISESHLMEEKVSDTGLTYGWILDILKNYDNKFQKIINSHIVTKITANDISDNKGYCSRIFKTKIFVDNQDEHIYNFVIKIPTSACIEKTYDGKVEENSEKKLEVTRQQILIAKLHNAECDFYDIFKDFEGLPMPKVSYTQKWLINENQIGAIFMEDLSQKMQCLNMFGSLNVIQIKEVVRHIACFHSYLYETEHLWKKKFFGHPFIGEEFIGMCKTMNELAIKSYPELEIPIKKLDNMTYDTKLIEFLMIGCCKEIGKKLKMKECCLEVPTLVALGDIWTNNLMFEKCDDNVPNKVLAFVDFQLAFEGNPAFDIARIVTTCTDAEIRRELETFIFDYYYENLTENLKKIEKIPDFTVEQFKLAYGFAMINQATWLPMMSMTYSTNCDVAENIREARNAKLIMRTKFALEDAAKKLETLNWVIKLNG